MTPFRSFLMSGFEGSTHRRPDGVRVDVIAASGHDRSAEQDYAALARLGIRTVRDAARWHRIEAVPGRYDWTSWQPMLDAAARAEMQVVWDLCHYGIPDWADLGPDFADRFAAYCHAAAGHALAVTGDAAPVYCLVNEISYWAFAVDHGAMVPAPQGGRDALKRILVQATIRGIDAVRAAVPQARFLHPEPLIHVAPLQPEQAAEAECYRQLQFGVFDMLTGRLAPELGGSPAHLDLPGANFYHDNQWFHGGPTIPFGSPAYRPLGAMLRELQHRYGRPVVVSETGAEGEHAAAWLRHVAGEARAAVRAGVPLLGVCLYPTADYPGWADGRHCRCGVLRIGPDWSDRSLDEAVVEVIRHEAAVGFASAPRQAVELARVA